jgi:preprotein translocase subunit SecE
MAVDETVEKKSRRRRKNQDEDADGDKGITEGKGRATPGKRTRSTKKEGGNFITRSFRGMAAYLSGVQDELDKVVWPTREELVRLSRIVIAVTIASAIMLGFIAFIFTELFILGLDNEWLFLAFAAVCALGYVLVRQLRQGSNQPPF